MGKYCKSEKFPIGQPKASFLKKNYASFFKKACIIFEEKKTLLVQWKDVYKKKHLENFPGFCPIGNFSDSLPGDC